MTDKQIIIDGKECRYWFRPNPDDYRKCALRGKDDNCDEIKDCYIKELLGKLALKEQECEELKKECNEYFELMAIRTEVLAKIANKLDINTAIIENKEIFNKIGQLKTSKEQAEQKLEKITKIANGMHDMWINKTKYTDVYNLAEHLLNCELNRIINEFDEIDEVE